MDESLIGEAAGIVWQTIQNDSGPMTLAAIKRETGLKPDEAAAAIGWLAREGKLNFESDGRKTVISLAAQTLEIG